MDEASNKLFEMVKSGAVKVEIFKKYTLKESVANIAVKTGINRSKVYKAALELIKEVEISELSSQS